MPPHYGNLVLVAGAKRGERDQPARGAAPARLSQGTKQEGIRDLRDRTGSTVDEGIVPGERINNAAQLADERVRSYPTPRHLGRRFDNDTVFDDRIGADYGTSSDEDVPSNPARRPESSTGCDV